MERFGPLDFICRKDLDGEIKIGGFDAGDGRTVCAAAVLADIPSGTYCFYRISPGEYADILACDGAESAKRAFERTPERFMFCASGSPQADFSDGSEEPPMFKGTPLELPGTASGDAVYTAESGNGHTRRGGAGAENIKKRRTGIGSFLFSLLIFLFFRIESWLCSIPAWVTLILHFTVSLPIVWFWATLAVWLAAGLLRYAFITFAIRCGNSPDPVKENKNPYSEK